MVINKSMGKFAVISTNPRYGIVIKSFGRSDFFGDMIRYLNIFSFTEMLEIVQLQDGNLSVKIHRPYLQFRPICDLLEKSQVLRQSLPLPISCTIYAI